jgi:hypothetical protein
MLHQVNIITHIIAGMVALVIGLFAIVYNRRVILHIKLGRYFIYFLSVVIVTGYFGFFLFGNDPFLLMLTLIASYVGFAGFRNIQLKEKRGTALDVVVALTALISSLTYVCLLSRNNVPRNITVVSSTLAALLLVTTYDLMKYFFFHDYLRKAWLYEHIYKMISAFSALLSAFAGNVFRDFHPYSQVGPSAFCTLLIIYFISLRMPKRHLAKVAGSEVSP